MALTTFYSLLVGLGVASLVAGIGLILDTAQGIDDKGVEGLLTEAVGFKIKLIGILILLGVALSLLGIIMGFLSEVAKGVS